MSVVGWGGDHLNPPVVLDWPPTNLKILGVFVGLGNLEENNWKCRINAVEKLLLSWHQHN